MYVYSHNFFLSIFWLDIKFWVTVLDVQQDCEVIGSCIIEDWHTRMKWYEYIGRERERKKIELYIVLHVSVMEIGFAGRIQKWMNIKEHENGWRMRDILCHHSHWPMFFYTVHSSTIKTLPSYTLICQALFIWSIFIVSVYWDWHWTFSWSRIYFHAFILFISFIFSLSSSSSSTESLSCYIPTYWNSAYVNYWKKKK